MKIKKLKYKIIILFLVISTTQSLYKKAYSQQYTEYEVKTAYIYNFVKFVKWPNIAFENDNTPFIIGIYGNDPFDSIMRIAFKDRTLYDRKWLIVNFYEPSEITKCNLLFVSKVEQSELLKVFDVVKNYNTLTIGDNIENFCQQGGIINFTNRNENRRFEINNEAAVRAKLTISSKLLSLAKIISENENRF